MPEDAKGQGPVPEGEAKKEEQPKAEAKGKGKGKDDLGALKASLNRQADGLRTQLADANARLAQYEEQDAEVKAKLEAANLAEDPEKLGQRVMEQAAEIARLQRQATQWGEKGLDAMAEAQAARILIGEDTGVFDELVQQLKGADSESALRARAESLASGLKALSELGIGAGTASSDDQSSEVDGGTASAGGRDVLAEMRETPLEEWKKKKEGFRRRVFQK